MTMPRRLFFPGIIPALLFGLCPASRADPEPSVTAHRLSAPPVIDGRLDDGVWKEAAIIEDFRQDDPVAGDPPSEKTVVYLGYDADAIYIGIRAFDREPDKIVARLLQDDVDLAADDSIYVAFDSLRDRKNAYSFAINPLGTKSESRIENNTTDRAEWNGIWYGAAGRDGSGWTAEMAIPVKTLSIQPGATTWGMNIFRQIRRRNEWVNWANVSQDREYTDVRHFGDVQGLDGLHQGRGLDLIPALALRGDWNEDAHDADLTLKPGGEVVYKLRPSLNASLLVNPDFSDSTVDQIQTNLTRFALLFPEQRDFFVRDADTFEFGGLREANGMPFFSRRVGLKGDVENPDSVDIELGAKLSGRMGPYTMGLFNTQMDDFDPVVGDRNLTVARLARDVGAESRAGAILTWGDPQSTRDNGVMGADYRYRNSSLFGDMTFIADGFLMRSFTSGVEGQQGAWGVNLDFPNDRWNARLGYHELQENFNPALGFVNRPGIRNYTGARCAFVHASMSTRWCGFWIGARIGMWSPTATTMWKRPSPRRVCSPAKLNRVINLKCGSITIMNPWRNHLRSIPASKSAPRITAGTPCSGNWKPRIHARCSCDPNGWWGISMTVPMWTARCMWAGDPGPICCWPRNGAI